MIIEKAEPRSTEFKDVSGGTCFKIGVGTFCAFPLVIEHNNFCKYNAVDLKNGCPCYIKPDDEVVVFPDAKVVLGKPQ